MMYKFVCGAAGLFYLVLCTVVTAQPRYLYVDLHSYIGGDTSAAFAINNAGFIAAHSQTGSTQSPVLVYPDFTTLVLGEYSGVSRALGISDTNLVVGVAAGAAFLSEKQGEVIALPTPRGIGSAYAVSAGRVAVGVARDMDNRDRAALWDKQGNYLSLGSYGSFSIAYGINSSRQIAGWSQVPCPGILQTRHAVLWQYDGTKITMHDLGVPEGMLDSFAKAINEHGDVVGFAQPRRNCNDADNVGRNRAFLWSNGEWFDLHTLSPELGSRAEAINNLGVVVGSLNRSGFYTGSFIWENGKMYDLAARVWGIKPGVVIEALGINDAGTIIGRAYDTNSPAVPIYAFALLPLD